MPGIIVSVIAQFGGYLASLQRIANETKKTTDAIEKQFNGLKKIGGTLGGLFLVSEIVDFSKSLVDFGANLQKVANQTQLTVQQVGALQYLAAQTGVNFEELTSDIERLQRSMGLAAQGTTQFVRAFTIVAQTAGLSAEASENFKKAVKAQVDGFELLKSLNEAGTGFTAAKLRAQLTQILNRGDSGSAAALRIPADQFQKYIKEGLDVFKNADEAARAAFALDAALKTLSLTFKAALLPALTTLVPILKEILGPVIDALKDGKVADAIIAFFTGMGKAIAGMTEIQKKRKELEDLRKEILAVQQANLALENGPAPQGTENPGTGRAGVARRLSKDNGQQISDIQGANSLAIRMSHIEELEAREKKLVEDIDKLSFHPLPTGNDNDATKTKEARLQQLQDQMSKFNQFAAASKELFQTQEALIASQLERGEINEQESFNKRSKNLEAYVERTRPQYMALIQFTKDFAKASPSPEERQRGEQSLETLRTGLGELDDTKLKGIDKLFTDTTKHIVDTVSELSTLQAEIAELYNETERAIKLRFDATQAKRDFESQADELKKILQEKYKEAFDFATKYRQAQTDLSVKATLESARGDPGAAAEAQFEVSFGQQLNEAAQDKRAERVKDLFTYKNIVTQVAKINTLEADQAKLLQDLGTYETKLNTAKDAGYITELDRLREIQQARLAQIPALQAIADKRQQEVDLIDDPRTRAREQSNLDAFRAQITEIAASAKELERQFRGIFVGSFTDALADAVTGVKSLKEAFEDMAKSIINALVRIAAQNVAESIFSAGSFSGKGIASLAGLFLGGGSAAASAPVADGYWAGGGGGGFSAKGNVFDQSGFKKFALGGMFDSIKSFYPSIKRFASGEAFSGVVSSPSMFAYAGGMGVMGEAGPEAVVPLKRGYDGKLGIAASSGMVVHNSFVINGPADTRTQSQIAAAAAAGLQRASKRNR
jgi:hypothetical protein